MEPSSIVQRRDNVLMADVGGEIVLMSVEQGNYFGLDATGSHVWRLIEQPIAVTDLCQQLAREYAASTQAIERDVLALLDQLERHGLLVAPR